MSNKKSITNEEINRCNAFCEQDYPRIYDDKVYKQKRIKQLKSLRTLFNGKLLYTNKDMSKILKREKEYSKKTCKRIYCNPNCGRDKPLRYVSEHAKDFNIFQKRGAITACMQDIDYKFVKKLKPMKRYKTIKNNILNKLLNRIKQPSNKAKAKLQQHLDLLK
jgi:hypothetical protein